MIDDPNTEYEDRPEYDEEGNPIWYMPELPKMDEFTEYEFNDVPENIPNNYYETVWSNTTATTYAKGRSTQEDLTDPIDVIIANSETDYRDEQGQINALEVKYNEAANQIITVLTNALRKGYITGEDNAEFLAAQHELTTCSEKIKDICDNQTRDKKIQNAAELKSKYQASTASELLDVLTEGGTKPWIYMDENNNVLLDGQSIPELTMLVNKFNLIATGGDDESRLTLTPEFIETVVQQTGNAGVKAVLTKYYLSTSTTELIGGTWLDTLPTASEQQGKYLWYKIVTIYNNPDKEPTETDPVCISSEPGKDGVDGADGADGVDGYTIITTSDTIIFKEV